MNVEVFKVAGMHCASCTMLIDETLEELDGVVRSETDLRRGETRVEFEPGMLQPARIIAAIKSAGYDAEHRDG